MTDTSRQTVKTAAKLITDALALLRSLPEEDWNQVADTTCACETILIPDVEQFATALRKAARKTS